MLLLLLLLAGVLFLALVAVLFLLQPARYDAQNVSTGRNGKPKKASVQIVVLGDIGHSPRMQYHALSIAKHGGHVSIIGYQNSVPHSDLINNPLVSIISLSSPPSFLQTSNRHLFPLVTVLKLVYQTWGLWAALAYRSRPAEWMLVQNPPAAPTLAIAKLACVLRNTRLVIDWHNFGYSILALKLGISHPMVKLMKWHELSFCRHANAHFCVSNAMARQLREDGGIKTPILVLHDRPPPLFKPIHNDKNRKEFLFSLPETAPHADALMSGKRRLLVSSTSWTPDEDFALLIDALGKYSTHASTSNLQIPPLCVIITGKGPQKEMYLSKIAELSAAGKLDNVSIKSAWLSLEDYACLLACADLGVSLHTSSSGVDLPMKVVDMFGAGLPVAGWNQYEAWPELVTEGVNGLGFGSAEELLSHLVDAFAVGSDVLPKLRKGAVLESTRRWDDEWDPVAGRLFKLIS